MNPQPRLYLDVTSACQSSLNTGVKRMQRGLHHWLRQRAGYTPVYWQSARRDYRILTRADDRNLDLDVPGNLRGLSLYDAPFLAGLVSDGVNYWRDKPLLLRWPEGLRRDDVVLVPDLLWDNRSAFFQRLKDCPARRVGIFHDAIALRRPGPSGIDRWLCARGVRALSCFDLVLCISREAEEDLHYFWRKFNLRAAPTQIAPWPVPFEGERPDPAPQFSARSVLYVARLEEHKNHLRLLDACELLWAQGMSFRLRLIGCNAYPAYSRRVRRRIEALRKKGRDIGLRAHVGEPELREAYRACSFTVFPSLREGFGLPVLESLWHGRPVVCAATGAVGEVAAGGGCAPIDPEKTDDIALGIQELLNDEAAYRRLHEQTRLRPFRRWSDYWRELEPRINPVCQS